MSAQKLVPLGATDLQKSNRRSDTAVISPQADKEKDISSPYVSGKFNHRCSKIKVYDAASVSALFLTFPQIHARVLIKECIGHSATH